MSPDAFADWTLIEKIGLAICAFIGLGLLIWEGAKIGEKSEWIDAEWLDDDTVEVPTEAIRARLAADQRLPQELRDIFGETRGAYVPVEEFEYRRAMRELERDA